MAPALLGKAFIFYYLWYGTPASDGHWQHWDHEVLPHWTPSVNNAYPSVGTRHTPPDSVHSPYYPLRGPYSSTNTSILDEHFGEMRALSSGDRELVVVLSWWGRADSPFQTSDTQGVETDDRVLAALDAAETAGIQCAWHLEPYPGRSAATVRDDVMYLEQRFSAHPGVFREDGKAVYFVYDSYHVSASSWKAELIEPLRRTGGY